MRTRSPLRKEGAHSWVTTRVLPSSMRKVMRYTRSLLEELPVVPAVPELPVADELPRGTTSIRLTTALGALVEAVAVEDVSWPVLGLWPMAALAAAVLPVEVLPAMLPLVSAVLLLVLPVGGVLCAASPLVTLEVVLAISLPLPLVPVELQAASPSASKPAKTTLCSLRFMINSFGWGVFFSVCVTIPRATSV